MEPKQSALSTPSEMPEYCCAELETHEDLIACTRVQMPDEEVLYDVAELFKVFGDSTRIRILSACSIMSCAYATWQSCWAWGKAPFPISYAFCAPPAWFAPGAMAKQCITRWMTSTSILSLPRGYSTFYTREERSPYDKPQAV